MDLGMRDALRAAIAEEMSMAWDDYVSSGGTVHTRAVCRASRKAGAPSHCVIHNPSKHKMRDWPMVLRSSGLIERQCPHGVGHPDPDSVAYLNWCDNDDAWGIHGCDGCCFAPETVESEEKEK
jgi:hypothetical protein